MIPITMQRLIFLIIIFLTFTATQTQAQIAQLRFGAHDDSTRIVIDMKNQASYKAAVLKNPMRLVLDVNDPWREQTLKASLKGTPIKDYRYGPLKNNQTRLVFDLKQMMSISHAFYLPPSGDSNYTRLVIDLSPNSDGKMSTEYTSAASPAAPSNDNVAEAPAAEKPESKIVMQDDAKKDEVKPLPAAPIIKDAPAVKEKKSKPVIANAKPVIVIDAGHGGQDPGATGTSGVYEKDITLPTALLLADKLRESGKYEVILTRDDDFYLKLPERRNIAKEHHADLFMSIHADTIKDSSLRGASVYVLSEKSSDALAEELADSENKTDNIAGVDFGDEPAGVTDILIDLTKKETHDLSSEFANLIAKNFKTICKISNHSRRSAGFAVLKSVDVPSVLIELGFLSNKEDEALLVETAYQKKVAAAIAASVDKYFAHHQVGGAAQ